MQEEYTGTLLEDGHISIPKEIIDKLKITSGSKLHVTVVKVATGTVKERILSYAGLLSDLTEQEQRRFDKDIKRRNLFGKRKAEI
jgi:hypothetical protein